MSIKDKVKKLESKVESKMPEEPRRTIVLTNEEYAKFKIEGVKALKGIKCLFVEGNEAYEEIKEDLEKGKAKVDIWVNPKNLRELFLKGLTGEEPKKFISGIAWKQYSENEKAEILKYEKSRKST